MVCWTLSTGGAWTMHRGTAPGAAQPPAQPPLAVAAPEPDYRKMPFAAHGPVPEEYTEEETNAVERFNRDVMQRERKKGK